MMVAIGWPRDARAQVALGRQVPSDMPGAPDTPTHGSLPSAPAMSEAPPDAPPPAPVGCCAGGALGMLLPLVLMAGFGFAIYAIVKWATKTPGQAGRGAPPGQYSPEHALERERDVDRLYHLTIEQLGSDKIEVRIGALHTLERLAWENRKLHPAVCGTLEGFIRVGMEKPKDDPSSDKVPEDLLAAKVILGRMTGAPSPSDG